MKKLSLKLTLLIGLFVSTAISAQDVNVCMQELSIFAENVKVKNYENAMEPWMKVRENCPDINVAIYTYGERIIKHNIENGTPEVVEASKKRFDQAL